MARRKRRKTVGKHLPELLLFQRAGGIPPVRRRRFPATLGIEQGVYLPVVSVQSAEGLFTRALAQVIDQFVFQDADKPGPFRGASAKPVARLQGRDQRFLDQILRLGAIAQAKKGVAEQRVAMLREPVLGGREFLRFSGSLAHAFSGSSLYCSMPIPNGGRSSVFPGRVVSSQYFLIFNRSLFD